MFSGIYSEKKVLLTGHTGFKGGWLAEWLLDLGAEVHGYALDPLPEALLFGQLGLAGRLASDHRGDLSELHRLEALVADLRPDFVFHLAAQPLVRLSYEIPVGTFLANVMGSIHVMEALRKSGHPCTAVMVTTDKCYENREWLHGYREEDAMGGHDPYSASKGAAEIAIASYRRSYFSKRDSPVALASARAGNVIGGGDWAMDRIIPDCFRALAAGQSISVRNKIATRPWQHVLEPLSGYLQLGAALFLSRRGETDFPASALSGAFNFGPALSSNRTVEDLVRELLRHTGGTWIDASDPAAVHEASKLNLSTDKAFHLLGWQPVWDFARTLAVTADWYLQCRDLPPSGSRQVLTLSQIRAYTAAAASAGLPWAG
ncbi:MAG: CDP-glucose 4,6-dehydratase [Verrucomicrobiaceae bacterium]|nr:MAG: CDP-glucose 4,6-dehydratase [Verrucomicrobiaceae bacterium]